VDPLDALRESATGEAVAALVLPLAPPPLDVAPAGDATPVVCPIVAATCDVTVEGAGTVGLGAD
jgi:hypothetical protein